MLEGTCDARFNQAGRDAFFALGDVAPSWTIEEGARMAAVRAHHIFRWCARTLRPADALRPTWWGSLARSGWHGENARRIPGRRTAGRIPPSVATV